MPATSPTTDNDAQTALTILRMMVRDERLDFEHDGGVVIDTYIFCTPDQRALLERLQAGG